MVIVHIHPKLKGGKFGKELEKTDMNIMTEESLVRKAQKYKNHEWVHFWSHDKRITPIAIFHYGELVQWWR